MQELKDQVVQSEDGSPTPENLKDGVVEPALEIEAGNANKDQDMEDVQTQQYQ